MKIYHLFIIFGVLFLIQVSGPTIQQPQFVESDLYAGPLIEEHVISLPEDGDQWETIVVAQQNHPVVGWFESEPRLRNLKQSTKFYNLPPDHWWVKSRIPNQPLPAVIVQRPTSSKGARRYYTACGSNIPSSSRSLANEIAVAVSDCPDGKCPPNQPGPVPDQTVLPDIRPNIIPNVNLSNQQLILIGAAVLAFLVYLFKKE